MPQCLPYAEDMDPYAVLGVSPDASQKAIRQSYLKLARQTHPDVRGNDPAAAEHMRQINQAWALLSDAPSRDALAQRQKHRPRHHYDETDLFQTPVSKDFEEAFADDYVDREFTGDDRPITSGHLPGWIRLGAPMSFVFGIFSLIVGLMIGIAGLVTFALGILVVSGLLFLLAPFVVLATSRHRSATRITASSR